MKRIFALMLAVLMLCGLSLTAYAASAEEATIDTSRTGKIDLWKYDLTNAEKDGLWDSSYVSTGVRDVNGVESILGGNDRVSSLNANGDAYGYALKGVEFTYIKVADIRTYTESEDGVDHVEVLYGIIGNSQNAAFLDAIGVKAEDRYTPADATVDGKPIYYFRSDVLIDGLRNALNVNATSVKNALENYAVSNGGVRMAETDAYGHSAVSDLPLGLYLFVETKVPEMVTETTAPFLVSVPMTSVDGSNASDGGTRWIYDIALYPKNLTGIPTLEKTLREAKSDTGKNNASASIKDGFAHTGTASDGDVIEYQIVSTLPSITSQASFLTDYSFVDTLSSGFSYNKNDVVLEFFKDAACTQKISSWKETDGLFSVSYSVTDAGESVMSISMTDSGLKEINTSSAVYTGANMVNSGYSDCTLRITYAATMHSDTSVVYGDAGNDNDVVMTWRRSNNSYYDTLVDDAHVYTYGIDLTKQFSDGKGNLGKVEFLIHNDSDNYFVTAALNQEESCYYVTGHVADQKDATHFIPTVNGKVLVKGLEDDTYSLIETSTDNAYTLLKSGIKVIISASESEKLCDIYAKDSLGLIQNDPRYANVDSGRFHNMPQKHLEHRILTASATVDTKNVNMVADETSANAFAPLTVVNTRGFDLPQTGGTGNWMFPTIGITGFALCMLGIYFVCRKKKPTSR